MDSTENKLIDAYFQFGSKGGVRKGVSDKNRAFSRDLCQFINAISNSPNIHWEIIEKYPDNPWDWDGLSSHSNITWEIIRQNPDKPWNINNVKHNPNITTEIYDFVCAEPWEYKWVDLCSIHMSSEFISQNIDKPWRFELLSKHPNITWEIVHVNPDKPWDWGIILRNKSVIIPKEKILNFIK